MAEKLRYVLLASREIGRRYTTIPQCVPPELIADFGQRPLLDKLEALEKSWQI